MTGKPLGYHVFIPSEGCFVFVLDLGGTKSANLFAPGRGKAYSLERSAMRKAAPRDYDTGHVLRTIKSGMSSRITYKRYRRPNRSACQAAIKALSSS